MAEDGWGSTWYGPCGLLGLAMSFGSGGRSPQRRSLADWVLAEDESFEGSCLYDYPLDAEYESVLDWCLQSNDRNPLVLVECSEQPVSQDICRQFASQHPYIRLLAGGCADGGWVAVDGAQRPSADATSRNEPISAMAVAALLTDAVRAGFCPLSTDIAPVERLSGVDRSADNGHRLCDPGGGWWHRLLCRRIAGCAGAPVARRGQ